MLLRQTLLYLPAQVLSPLVQFASILIWAHLLAPGDLGVVTMIVAMQEICFAGFFGWWSRYTLRFITSFQTPERRARYLRTEVVAILGSVLVQSLVVWPLLTQQLPEAVTPRFLLLATAFMITRSISNYMSERARADARIALYSLIQIAGPVIGFGVGLLMIWRMGPSPDAVLVGFIIAQTLGLIAGLAMCDFGRAFGRPDGEIFKVAVKFGGAVMTASLLAIVAVNAPRFIVNHMLGVAAVGLFAVGYGLGMRASAFAVTLVTAGAYPMVVKKMETEGRGAAFAQLSKNMVLVVMTVAPVAFGLLAVNRAVVDLLVAERFREVTYAVLPLATLGGLFRYMRAHTTDQVFLVSLRPGYSTMIAVCDLAVAAASSYGGMLLWGVTGAAIGPMVSGLVTLTLSFVLSRLHFGYRAPVGAFLRILAAAAGMGLVVYLIPARHSFIMLGVAITVGGLLYAGLVALLMPSERRLITDAIVRRLRRREAKPA